VVGLKAIWVLSVALVGMSGTACDGAAPATSTAAIVLTESDNGKTVTAQRHQMIRLELHSTYWMLSGPSDATVLQPTNGPTVIPSPGCVPGQGCGAVVATYQAMAAGHAQLSASRTTCGEALTCTPSNGSFAVLVVVQN
jgi:hypothetical protein